MAAYTTLSTTPSYNGREAILGCTAEGCTALVRTTTTRDGRVWVAISTDRHYWMPWETTAAYPTLEAGQAAVDAAWASHRAAHPATHP